MKNKSIKKYLFLSLLVNFIFFFFFCFINYNNYRTYQINYNNSFNTVLTLIIDKYPDVNVNDIIEELDSENRQDILKKYGLDENLDTAISLNEKQYKNSFMIYLILFLLLIVMEVLIVYIYYKNRNKKLFEITNYIKKISNKNYKLDIDNNNEDDLSFLKNELYKITIMLKEEAENSKKDKLMLKDSLSDISHQLKTPLTSIIIMLDNIIENKDMDSNLREEFITDIYREINNINFLVQVILKLSKFDANVITFNNKNELLSKIINESVKNVSALCDLKNVKVNIHGDKKIIIYCDFNWQVEALSNILKNACECSSTININYEENEMFIKIIIEDDGNGINEDDLPHVFERFYKGKNSSKDSIGIGLSLSKSIIEKNNGYINVQSIIHKGTTFTIKYYK